MALALKTALRTIVTARRKRVEFSDTGIHDHMPRRARVLIASAASALFVTGFAAAACGGTKPSAADGLKRAPKLMSVITRVEGSTTVIETITSTVTSITDTAPSVSEQRREAFNSGYYNCKQLPTSLVKKAIVHPAFRPQFMRIVAASTNMATSGQFLNDAIQGCLKALMPRIPGAKNAFANPI